MEKSLIKPEYKYSELTGQIIGCCMEVHKALGNGFQEVIYQRALEHEFRIQGTEFQRELEMPIYYTRIPPTSKQKIQTQTMIK